MTQLDQNAYETIIKIANELERLNENLESITKECYNGGNKKWEKAIRVRKV